MSLDGIFRPRLSAENSIVVALAATALIVGLYAAKIGPVADVHATDANDGNMRAALKKSGWESVLLIAGVTLLSGDLNVAILGGAAVIAEEMTYRHALISNPSTGQIQVTPASYQPASSQVQVQGSIAATAG